MSQDVTDCARTADTINSAPASTNWSPILGQPVNAERGYSARRAVKPKGNNISERMRRWRRENAEKNRMNDLRCRVYRQARIRFGRESTPEKETWIQHEIARRLERQRQGRVAKVENRGGNHTSSSSLPNRHQRDMPTNLSRFPGLKFINMLHDGRTVYSYASPMTPDQGLGLPNLPDLTTSVPTGSLPSSNASASLTITQSIPAVFVMPSLEDTLGCPFQLPAPDYPIEDDSSSSSSSGGSDTVLPSLSTYHQQSICPGVSTTPANVAPAETEVGGDSFSLVSTPTTIIAAGTADSQDEPIGYLSAAYSSQDLL
ncbi:hypothetical protein EV182_001582 [Spiromyces aspiralis]|uniref:Uncharacterized protein n=1 Tax=Spiromyces aspiralis TaxID=68401 RepID=A0ACC1HVA1_9FUNG|nr:hypothetical protein EV182_001582 [Spiromyces aspiralis]